MRTLADFYKTTFQTFFKIVPTIAPLIILSAITMAQMLSEFTPDEFKASMLVVAVLDLSLNSLCTFVIFHKFNQHPIDYREAAITTLKRTLPVFYLMLIMAAASVLVSTVLYATLTPFSFLKPLYVPLMINILFIGYVYFGFSNLLVICFEHGPIEALKASYKIVQGAVQRTMVAYLSILLTFVGVLLVAFSIARAFQAPQVVQLIVVLGTVLLITAKVVALGYIQKNKKEISPSSVLRTPSPEGEG
jgi:hypothetical protein